MRVRSRPNYLGTTDSTLLVCSMTFARAWQFGSFSVLQVTRDKNVIKPAKGKRQCNCKNKMVTKQLGPGMFQQFQTQECEQCSNVKFARESETLQVTVEPGMKDNEVSALMCFCFCDSSVHDEAVRHWHTSLK